MGPQAAPTTPLTGVHPEPRSAGLLLRVGPLLAILVAVLASSLYAIDFGPHWDEDNAWLKPLERSLREGKPLPGKYNYPTFGYWITLLAILPEVVTALVQGADVSDYVIERIYGQPFRLRLRVMFLALSCLGFLWMHRLVLRWRGSWIEAALATALLAFSWEVAYHIRWVAPDGLLMQFGALTLLCTLAAVRSEDGRRWLYASAIAAGLGCGSKYPGGILIAPVLIAAGMVGTQGGFDIPSRLRQLAIVGALFVGTFLATTPGSLFEYEMFRRDLDYEMVHYRDEGHGVYTVEAGSDHLGRMLEYFGGHVLSPYEPVAWGLVALALVGIVALARERFMLFLLCASFPVLYVGYMSTMVVSAVRNVLVISPFLALFAARGAMIACTALRARPVRIAIGGAVAAAVTANLLYLFYAAERTRHRGFERSLGELFEHVASNDDQVFALSPRVRAGLAASGALAELPNTAEPGAEGATHVATLAVECAPAIDTWVLGPIDLFWFGPKEINFRYYPTAWGYEERILVMPVATARQVGLQ